MAVTSWDRSSASLIDEGYKDSVRTTNYHQLVSEGKLLPVNPFLSVSFNGSTPRKALPTSQGGGLYGYQSIVPKVSCNMFEVLYNAGSMWCKEVTINNGNLPASQGSSVTFKGFPSLQQDGLKVTNKLVKKLNSRDIDLGVALGEARETAAFVQSAMLRLYRAFHSARRGDASGMLQSLGLTRSKKPSKQQFRDVPDAAAGVWLEYSYAVRPLLGDVYGAVSALEKRHKRPEVVHTRARIFSELNHAMATTGAQPGRLDVSWECKGSVISTAELSFEIANPFTYTLSQLGLTNPLNVAWELVPFSFVVDWFIPIGAWFDGLVPPQGISNLKGSQSYKGEFHGKGKLIGNFPVPPNTSDGTREFSASWYSKFKGRSPITSYPRYHLVGATFDLSKSQIASGLSLLWAVGNGRKAEKSAYENAVKHYNLGTVRDLSRAKDLPKFPRSYENL